MSANDADEFEMDFSDLEADVTTEMREADLSQWREEQDALRRAEDEEVAATRNELDSPSPVTLLHETVVPSGPETPTDEPDLGVLPADFDQWTEANQVSWAWPGEEVPRWEVKERRRLYAGWQAARPPRDDGRNPIDATPSSWTEVELGDTLDQIDAGTLQLPVATVGIVADGKGLFYAARVNALVGESGAGKGWVLLAIAVEQMLLGRHVWYIDFEDSAELALLRLVKTLGVPSKVVRMYFHFVAPETHDLDGIAKLASLVAATTDATVIVDSTGEAMGAAALNQNIDPEVRQWMKELARPLASAGACVILVDHTVKSLEGGAYGSGSQRKRASLTGAMYMVEVVQAFAEDEDGLLALKVAKDRLGGRAPKSTASFVQITHPIDLVTDADGEQAMVMRPEFSVYFGAGKTSDQMKADKAASDAKKLDANVAAIDAMDPKPKNYREVKVRLGIQDKDAQDAMREWKLRQKP